MPERFRLLRRAREAPLWGNLGSAVRGAAGGRHYYLLLLAAHMTDHDDSSRPLAQASARGTVKWFNATKGYGFITLDDGSDAFCHASALAEIGNPNLPPGATVVCDLQESPRGLQVVAVHSVDTSTAQPMPARRPRPFPREGGFGGERPAGPAGPMTDGKVKFFNEQKGFGFVMPDDGGADVYVHASALRRSGVATLAPDQRVRFSTRQGVKGIEVDRIEEA